METFVGDTVTLRVDCGIDVSLYTTLRIKYRKPNGVSGFWPATLCSTSNNHIVYTTDHDDLDVNGNWRIQSFVMDFPTDYLNGAFEKFKVYKLLSFDSTSPPTTAVPTTTFTTEVSTTMVPTTEGDVLLIDGGGGALGIDGGGGEIEIDS